MIQNMNLKKTMEMRMKRKKQKKKIKKKAVKLMKIPSNY